MNRRRKVLALIAALAGVFALLAPVQSNARPTVGQAVEGTLPIPTGTVFQSPWTCLQDQTWGSYYPSRIHTAVNSWNGPADFGMVYRGDDVPGGVQLCTSSPAFPDARIIKIGLWPAERANEVSWCVAKDSPAKIPFGDGRYYWASYPIIYINYYRSNCAQHAAADSIQLRNLISSYIGFYVGLSWGYLSNFYSVMNLDRSSEIPWPTANDLYRVNDIY